MDRRVPTLLLLVTALGLAVVGQFYFLHRRDYLWDGLIFHGLAAACFLLAWRVSTSPRERHPTPPRPLRVGRWWRERSVPAVLLTVGLLLSGCAVLLARNRLWNQSTYDVVAVWLLGLATTGAAALWPGRVRLSATREDQALFPTGQPDGGDGARAWRRLLRDWRVHLGCLDRQAWLEIAALAVLTASALALRATALAHVPYTLGGDEAWHGLLARQVLRGELRNPFVIGYMSMPTLFYWPLSWSLWLVGDGVAGLRLPAALAGTLTVPALYLLARRLWGWRTGFLSALFLAAYDYHIHYSRLGANNIWDPLLAVLLFWLLEQALTHADEAGRRRASILAGLVLGFGVYSYTGARLLPVLAAAQVAFTWLRRRFQPASSAPTGGLGRLLVWLSVAFLVAAGPMLSYALVHPAEWNARLNQVGIIQSGWLSREPALTGKSTTQILAEQFLRAAGAFHVFPDRTVWYGADRPLLGFLAGVFALWGMVWAIVHWRERRYFLILAWFWAVIISGGMLTESPPSSQRLVMAMPTVALLVAIGLEQTVGLARRVLDVAPDAILPYTRRLRLREGENLVLGLLIAILAAGSVGYYYLAFTPSRRYGSANAETATMIGYYLRDLGTGCHVYFFGAPRIYWSFGSMAFLAPGASGEDVLEPLSAPPDFPAIDSAAVAVFLPERAGELSWVQQALPGGRLLEYRDARGQLRFITYEPPSVRRTSAACHSTLVCPRDSPRFLGLCGSF